MSKSNRTSKRWTIEERDLVKAEVDRLLLGGHSVYGCVKRLCAQLTNRTWESVRSELNRQRRFYELGRSNVFDEVPLVRKPLGKA